jgi:hypothetical protein
MKIGIQIGLALLAGFMAYLVWDSIESKIILTETVKMRRSEVKERLTQIGDAQIEYKKVRGSYASSFEELSTFLKNDSIVQVKMEGEVPDSLLGQEALALKMGIIKRDTTRIPVREVLFSNNFDEILKKMPTIPFSGGKQFTFNAGTIEKNKNQIPVFEVSADLKDVYAGLETNNEGYDMSFPIAVGSMEEPTTNGNWKD